MEVDTLRIHKINFDGVEYLPDITDTPLWKYLDPDRACNTTRVNRQIAGLYDAIAKRENYYQDNNPTAYGNPDYSYLCGIAQGYMKALEVEEIKNNKSIIISKIGTGKKILEIDIIERPDWYKEAVRDNRELLRSLGV